MADKPAKPEQIRPASLEQASARWIREGQAFAAALNTFIEGMYRGIKGSEPSDPRGELADYVREQVVELNRRGEGARARELFPPAHEPFVHDYEQLARSVTQLVRLGDGSLLVRIGDYYERDQACYHIDGERVTKLADALALGASPDRRWVALAYGDRIELRDSVAGEVVQRLAAPADHGAVPDGRTSAPIDPSHFAKATTSIHVSPDRDRVLIASRAGIWHYKGDAAPVRLHPADGDGYWREPEGDDARPAFDLDYPHAAVAPDFGFAAMGDQSSPHRLVRRGGGGWNVDPLSEYPHFAVFHDQRPHVALSSCHFARSRTAGVDLSDLDAGAEIGELDDRHWMFSGVPVAEGYALGANNGYIWCKTFDGNLAWYLHLGSTITAMDISPDKRTLVAGTHSGYVVELALEADRSPYLVTNARAAETRRWAFWRHSAPLVW